MNTFLHRMYHYHTQQQFHYNSYQINSANIKDESLQNLRSKSHEQFRQDLAQNVVESNSDLHIQNQKGISSQCLVSEGIKSKESKLKSGKDKETGRPLRRPAVDTSSYSVEERLVAAVWVHERKNTSHTISEIKHNFRKRFGRDPPSKTTLLTWEQKLFSTGNVCDAPRTGRPVNRQRHISAVSASVSAAPALSVRARARALRLPRSTLHHILRHDLPRAPPAPAPHPPAPTIHGTDKLTLAPAAQGSATRAPSLGYT